MVRPQPGQATDLGQERAQAHRLQDLLGDLDLALAGRTGLRGQGHADRVADALVEEDRQPGGRGDDPLVAHPGLREAQVERVVAAGREESVHVDQVAHARHLGADDDPVVAQAGLLGELGGAQRRLEHRLDHHVAGVEWLGKSGVGVHELGQDGLVERAPVDADPDRFVVLDGDPDDRREVLVVAFRADVAGIDPVLGQELGHFRVVHEQLVAVVVEVTDDRDVDTEAADLADHLGDGGGGLLGVDRHAHELRAGVGQAGDLDRGRVRVGGVGVRHRLDDDRMGAARRARHRRRR